MFGLKMGFQFSENEEKTLGERERERVLYTRRGLRGGGSFRGLERKKRDLVWGRGVSDRERSLVAKYWAWPVYISLGLVTSTYNMGPFQVVN